MINISSLYKNIWILDFEFLARGGEHPEVVCMVAYNIIGGQWVYLWYEETVDPPFTLDEHTLFVGYSAAAEWSCFIALNWPMPSRCIDLYAEFSRITNGAHDGKLFPSLLAAAKHYGISTAGADHKDSMRDLILRGGPWDQAEQRSILHYCAQDVRVTAELFQAMAPEFSKNEQVLCGSLLRGRYTCAVARMEWTGIPIDVTTFDRICAGWEDIKLALIKDIDQQYGVFEGVTFVTAKFAAFLQRTGIPWPVHPSGDLMLDDDTFRERARSFPVIAPLRELRHALGKLRLISLAVGSDGRNRSSLMPFGSKTGRNQPSNSKFIFGSARWIRGLIKPRQGKALAYVDWSSQEIAIAAALSGDKALWEAYVTGDPYLEFAKRAGLAPQGATKLTHKAERQRAKAIVLGVGYGMSAESMATQAGLHIDEARELLISHRLLFKDFWKWVENIQNAGLLGIPLLTAYGWTWQAGFGTQVNPRSLLNYPMQANGAEMMRLACCSLTEQGILVCCPVHDALLIEAPIERIDAEVAKTRAAMEHASELVLGKGYTVKTDVYIVRYPDRYIDENGAAMWNHVMAILKMRGW
jgi:DNA polymerase-1